MEKSSNTKSQLYLSVIVNTFLMTALFVWLAFQRNVDGDEGLYLEAARLVAEGKSLYTDFFFQQMPMTPLFYAAWTEIFGMSLFSGRIFSALLTALAGGAALYYLAVSSRRVFVVSVGAILMYACGIYLAWAPVIKTHPFNAFFLTLSSVLVLLWARSEKQSGAYLAWAGLLLGLGIASRLTLAPFPLLYMFFIGLRAQGVWFRPMIFFLIGLAVGLFPCVYYLWQDPALFLKYNLTYHTQIFPGVTDPDFRWFIAKKVLLAPQILALAVLGYVGLLLKARRGWECLLASDHFFIVALSATFFAIHLSTAMPFTQYFSSIIPWMVMACLPALEFSLRWTASIRSLTILPLLLAYVALAPRFYDSELRYVGSLDPQWRVENVLGAVREARRFVRPGETCLTWWPGYAVLAGCRSVPGMENHMREHAVLRGVASRTLREYRMIPSEAVLDFLNAGRYRVLIDGAYRLPTPYNDYAEYLIKENYGLRSSRGTARIYTLKGAGDLLGEAFVDNVGPTKASKGWATGFRDSR